MKRLQHTALFLLSQIISCVIVLTIEIHRLFTLLSIYTPFVVCSLHKVPMLGAILFFNSLTCKRRRLRCVLIKPPGYYIKINNPFENRTIIFYSVNTAFLLSIYIDITLRILRISILCYILSSICGAVSTALFSLNYCWPEL